MNRPPAHRSKESGCHYRSPSPCLPSLAAKSVQPQNQAVRHCRFTGSQQRPGKHRLNHEATRKLRHSALSLPSEWCERNLQKHPRALESRRCYWCHRSPLQQSHIQHLCAGSKEAYFGYWLACGGGAQGIRGLVRCGV
jgi:hypothetical protein